MMESIRDELSKEVHVEGRCGKSRDSADLDKVRVHEDSVKY